MTTNHKNIGRLLRSNIKGCVVGTQVSKPDLFEFGSLVRIPLNDDGSLQVYGLVHDIHIDDDGLVKQLVAADDVAEEVILDNRSNRNVPIEISIIFVGYEKDKSIYHMLPPRPPLTLDVIYVCSPEEIVRFTGAGRFGYFRQILQSENISIAETFSAHLNHAGQVHKRLGDDTWYQRASKELIILLRDDYALLMNVISALSDLRME